MNDITQIASSIAAELLTMDEVDYASVNDYLPAIKTSRGKAAALIIPFGQRGETQIFDLVGGTLVGTYRIPVEFWIKHEQGEVATTMQMARDIGARAMRCLVAANLRGDVGFELDPGTPFEEVVNDTPVSTGNQPYVISRLTVPVSIVIEGENP